MELGWLTAAAAVGMLGSGVGSGNSGSTWDWNWQLIMAVLLLQVLHSDIDLLNPPAELERTKHKLKRLVQSPNSFFMDVKCTGCFSM